MDQEAILECIYKVAREEDTRSFKALYKHYFAPLFRFSFIIVHAKEPAEEIVNDVFINLWRRRDQLYKIENPDVYFYVAVKNKSLDYLSKNHLKERIDIREVSESYLKFSMDPEKILITEELKERIENAVERLPSRCKLIFKMIREDGLKYREVASILNLSIKTVEAQMTIAVKKLSQTITSPVSRRVKKRYKN